MANSYEIYRILKNLKNDICMYKNCVSKNIINSHLISKWILKTIILDYHVIAESNKNNSNYLLEKTGWMQEGVTFKLFCSEHDNEIFEPIENNNVEICLWNEQQIKILNYRTSCGMLYNYKLGLKKISDPDYNDIVEQKYKWTDEKKNKIKRTY